MDGQTEELVEQEESPREPVDIAEAFRMYNQQKQETSSENVDDTEGAEDNGPEDAGLDIGDEANDDSTDDESDGDSVGGSSDIIEPIDLSPAKQDYLKKLQNQAITNVRDKMKKDEIELWSIQDIYERDENTGRVTFHNPDDPNNPFKSRSEAQAFVNSMNEEVNNYFRKEVNLEQQRLVQQSAPVLQMFDFAPVYQQMNETEQAVFNDLIEPYAIRNNQGKTIAFNVNLQSVANTARQVAKRFSKQENSQAIDSKPQANSSNVSKPGSRPATDLPAGNGLSEDEAEPKTIGEALKMYDAQQRKAKEKKGK